MRRLADLPLPRRGVLAALVPAAAAACGSTPPPEPPLQPISYSYLIPLPLNVGSLRIDEANPAAQPGDTGALLSPTPAEAVRIMGRDRLSAVGTGGQAVFQVTRASLVRAGNVLTCQLACRVEVTGAEEGQRGFVEANARASVSGADATRPQAAERLLRRTMDGLNVEFEYQVKRNLRAWLVVVAPGSRGALPAPPAGEVSREELPRS
jgi:hypothetical protein